MAKVKSTLIITRSLSKHMDTSILYPSYVEQSIRKSDGAICTWVKAYAVLPKHEIVNYSSEWVLVNVEEP